MRTSQVGKVSEAVALLQALLVEQHRVLGPDHPETLTTRGDLAHLGISPGTTHSLQTDGNPVILGASLMRSLQIRPTASLAEHIALSP